MQTLCAALDHSECSAVREQAFNLWSNLISHKFDGPEIETPSWQVSFMMLINLENHNLKNCKSILLHDKRLVEKRLSFLNLDVRLSSNFRFFLAVFILHGPTTNVGNKSITRCCVRLTEVD